MKNEHHIILQLTNTKKTSQFNANQYLDLISGDIGTET